MVPLVEKFNKFYSKMENFPHHHKSHDDSESLTASLAAFRSKISNFLVDNLLKAKLRSENLSFSWIKRCLELVTVTDKAFAKLVMEIDHPMNKWEATTTEEYLNYTLNILDLLNLTSSSISHLGHARLQLTHALTTSKISSEPLKPIEMKIPAVDLSNRWTHPGSDQRKFTSKKEIATHEAMVELKNIGFWVCGVVLSALVMNPKPYMDVKNLAYAFSESMLRNVGDFEGIYAIEEVGDLNAAIAAADINNKISGDEPGERLKRRVKEVEEGAEEVGQVVDDIFSRILSRRNQLLGTIRLA